MGYYFRRGWAIDEEADYNDELLDGITAINNLFSDLSGPNSNVIPLEWSNVKAIQIAMEYNLGIEISATDVLEAVLEYNESQRDKEL